MDLGLKGKTALVTGGSRGIGAATASVMADEGANVVLVARDATRLEEVRTRIVSRADVRVDIVPCDLAQPGTIGRLAERFSAIDILVNNAGGVPVASLFEPAEAEWRAGWESKAFQYINLCRACYPAMKKRGAGVIVNVLGIASRLKSGASVWSGMGNCALEFLTEALGAASPADNIRVLGVAPGPVCTERYNALSGSGSAERAAALPLDPKALPFGRAASPEEIAWTIAFAASERSSYTSGTVIVVDAGVSVSAHRRARSTEKIP